VVGIVKAYITRVGEGPMPTELKDEVGERLREKGREFGTTTGRPRRCGWFDAVLARKSVYLNGYTEVALTKLDVLTGLDPVRICTGYELDGQVLDYPPESTDLFARCTPVYEDVEGWTEEITDARSYQELPRAVKSYVDRLEVLQKVKITIVSVGPGRKQTVRR